MFFRTEKKALPDLHLAKRICERIFHAEGMSVAQSKKLTHLVFSTLAAAGVKFDRK